MTPILLHMIDEQGNSMMGITQDQLGKALDQASEVIPDTVARIYLYWQWYRTHLNDKYDKTHLIHRPIDICDTSPPTPDKRQIVIFVIRSKIMRDTFSLAVLCASFFIFKDDRHKDFISP